MGKRWRIGQADIERLFTRDGLIKRIDTMLRKTEYFFYIYTIDTENNGDNRETKGKKPN